LKIAIAGKAGSGKSTAANYLVEQGFQKRALADKLKELCSLHREIHDNFEMDWSEHPELMRHVSDLFPEFSLASRWGVTSELWEVFASRTPVEGKDRSILQYVGTDIIRGYKDTAWVEYLIRTTDCDDYIVVDDVRFKDEFYMLKEAGWTMVFCAVPDDVRASRLEAAYGRPLTEEEVNHPSERDLDDLPACEWDWILNTAGAVETETAQVQELVDYLYIKATAPLWPPYEKQV